MPCSCQNIYQTCKNFHIPNQNTTCTNILFQIKTKSLTKSRQNQSLPFQIMFALKSQKKSYIFSFSKEEFCMSPNFGDKPLDWLEITSSGSNKHKQFLWIAFPQKTTTFHFIFEGNFYNKLLHFFFNRRIENIRLFTWKICFDIWLKMIFSQRHITEFYKQVPALSSMSFTD